MRNYAISSIAIAAVAALTMITLPTVNILKAQDFASIQTFQNDEHIVITITKAGANATKPTGPIVVIPPTELTNQTVSTPSAPGAGNITTIEPGGNVTVVPLPPNSNVTQIDNGTVIVAPPDRNITETPGNVTVIDPPPPVKAPECPCKLGNVTGGPLPPPNNVSGGIPAAPPGNATTPSPPMTSTNATTTNSTTSSSNATNATK